MTRNRCQTGSPEIAFFALLITFLWLGTWSVHADTPLFSGRSLPGSDAFAKGLTGYYEPIPLGYRAAAPGYQLPINLTTLTNTDFAQRLETFLGTAIPGQFNETLANNGFAALALGQHLDIARFYEMVKKQGLPVFITSDSLLHLLHLQFSEILRGIEERELFDELLLLSKAIQQEALNWYKLSDGELRQAARLLLGYINVPIALLEQTDLGTEADQALKEASRWPAGNRFPEHPDFQRRYAELLEAISDEQDLPMMSLAEDAEKLKLALTKYLERHQPTTTQFHNIPAAIHNKVYAELTLIDAHQGFAESPLFGYREDYSQYLPRGHYTGNKRLKQYFKALMWFGRMTFLIHGRPSRPDALVSDEQARIQTLAATLLAGMMEKRLPDNRTLDQVWRRVYTLSAFFVGFADQLDPYDYRAALRETLGESVTVEKLTDATKFTQLRQHLSRMREPEIYAGLGDRTAPPAGAALPALLRVSQGLRLMGQRYLPDSYMLGRLVYPTVGRFSGSGRPFTLVKTGAGAVRGLPRGLDVMAVLGSRRARYWLNRLEDDRYQRYDSVLNELQHQFKVKDTKDRSKTLYWAWLYTLQALLTEYGQGYPSFMRTPAWQDKQLTTALASWSQLRHDTVLYNKQSYTPMAPSAPAPTRMVEGYVEPVPQFYARLLALIRMTSRGLNDLDLLDGEVRGRLDATEAIVERLLGISLRELSNRRLSDKDYAFIRSFGSSLQWIVAESREGTESTSVADVHTDANSGQVLQQGIGYLHPLVVAYPMPDGGVVAGVGPIMSHYEFKRPMTHRLTDNNWIELLQANKAPSLPAWQRSYTIEGDVQISTTSRAERD